MMDKPTVLLNIDTPSVSNLYHVLSSLTPGGQIDIPAITDRLDTIITNQTAIKNAIPSTANIETWLTGIAAIINQLNDNVISIRDNLPKNISLPTWMDPIYKIYCSVNGHEPEPAIKPTWNFFLDEDQVPQVSIPPQKQILVGPTPYFIYGVPDFPQPNFDYQIMFLDNNSAVLFTGTIKFQK